jgi:predicted phage replisome organizer
MAEKKYYWLKLKRDFFKRHDIQIIESMPNGKDYVLFYLKLMVESIDHEGALRFSQAIPYNEQMLSVITNTNIDVVRAALELFRSLGMVDILDDQTIYMSEVTRLIGSESGSAERVRKHRETKALQCNTDVTKSNTEKEIEKDKELETELEIAKRMLGRT